MCVTCVLYNVRGILLLHVEYKCVEFRVVNLYVK